jgi:PAS domain S-box-containing protein
MKLNKSDSMNNFELENRIKELELELSILRSGAPGASTVEKMSFRKAIEKSIKSGVIDIIEHKKLEEKLLFINKAVESISDAISISDVNGHHFYQNKAFSDLFEYASAEELEAAGGGAMIVKDKKASKFFSDNIINGKSWAGELEMITKSGHVFTAFERADVIRDKVGNIIGFIYVITNITEYKQILLALTESETKFKEIINQINEGILVYDEHGKIIVWNKGAEKVTGINAIDILNKDIVDIQHQLTSHTFKDKDYIENLIKNIVTIQNAEVFNRTYDIEIEELNSGNLKNIQSIVFPIKLNEYNLSCAVFRDVTKIKQYEKQLLQLNVDKDRFISILAHDLKSPFNALLGLSEELSENIRQFNIDEIENMTILLNKSARNTYNLLEDILMWARTQKGKIPFEPQSLSFTDICKNILEVLKPAADLKNITINYSAADNLNVYADIYMLKTVLRNLVSNAIKFTNKNGVINIRAEEDSGYVTISVSDNGIGIEPDSLTRLFDMSQIYSTIGTANERGTGLGLLLCREFAERHGGKIWVESEKEIGSNFKFTLPIFR